MSMKLALALAIVVISIGKQAHAQDYSAILQPTLVKLDELQQKVLDPLQTAVSCDGKEVLEAKTVADALLAMGNGASVFEIRTTLLIKNGLFRTKLGDTLLSRNCLDQARSIYLEVIEKFTGSAFSSVRQRAQIGIDDIRAKR